MDGRSPSGATVTSWRAAWGQPGLPFYSVQLAPFLYTRRKDQLAHTDDELAEAFFMPGFDEEKFLQGAAAMLEGVKAFWDGLDADRRAGSPS